MLKIGMLLLALILSAPALGESEASSSSLIAAENALKEEDYALAFTILRPLAEQGTPEAQAHLGLMYELGKGVDIDFSEAFKWYRSAAEKGIAWAQTNLGLAYANGRGVEKNDKEAVKWYRRAALQGKARAQELLASMYDQGRGNPKSPSESANLINPSNLKYISKLKKDYGNKIHFKSKNAEKIIRGFNISCKGGDRYLPLESVLLARLASVNDDNSEMPMDTFVVERGGEVRIIDSYKTSGQEAIESASFQINKWGELTPMGSVTTTAVLNACSSSFGPIWLLK